MSLHSLSTRWRFGSIQSNKRQIPEMASASKKKNPYQLSANSFIFPMSPFTFHGRRSGAGGLPGAEGGIGGGEEASAEDGGQRGGAVGRV